MIAEQIRFLQKQTESILLEAARNANLHHVACNFVKQPGHVYHLYQRESGQLYFSMLSPEVNIFVSLIFTKSHILILSIVSIQEWGNSIPSQSYKGSFRLEQDRSWTSLSHLQAKDGELNLLEKILSSDMSTNTILHSYVPIRN